MDLSKRFSIAHYDSWASSSQYYEAIKNASPQFRNEIYDIYFGKIFRYEYREQEIWDNYSKPHLITYGNVMGVEASEEQVNNLFKIQHEFGIEISLTVNQLNIPVEIFYSKNNRVLGAFLDWLTYYYDRGLRCCTLANNHMMRSGLLHNKFPEMKWKNTVNQQVSNAQQVLDYLALGYNIVQLDRSLNRNFNEIKRIKEVVEAFKAKHPERCVKTSLLVWEDCMPQCPFKREHDDLQIYLKKINYWDSYLGALTCDRWTSDTSGESLLPRFGTNCCWVSTDSFIEFAESVDLFKYSGRLKTFAPSGEGNIRAGWIYKEHAATDSFSEILENSLGPIQKWDFGITDFNKVETDVSEIQKALKSNFWLSDAGRILEQRLKNCQNQCYKCHLCERSFGAPDVDSALEL